MYKESEFNISTQLGDGKAAVYNTRSGALLVLDKAPSQYEDEDTRDVLAKEGILVRNDVDEFDEVAADRRNAIANPGVLNFTVATTMRCQAHCSYCFQSAITEKAGMSLQTSEEVASYLIKRVAASKSQGLRILWFGGEPLLGLSSLFAIGGKVNSECHTHGIPFGSSMITNGIAMTPETTEEMVNKVALDRVQVSLEGMRETFLKVKGIDAFDQVVQNICNCSSLVRITVRMNLMRDNAEELERLMVYLLDDLSLDAKIDIYLAQVELTDGCAPGFFNSASGSKHGSEVARLFSTYSSRFVSLNPKRLLPLRKRCFCALERNGNYAIGPAGELYKCDRDIGHPERAVGDVATFSNQQSNLRGNFFDDLDERCIASRCPMLPTCLSRCPHDRLYNQMPKSCEDIIANAKLNIGIAAQLLRA